MSATAADVTCLQNEVHAAEGDAAEHAAEMRAFRTHLESQSTVLHEARGAHEEEMLKMAQRAERAAADSGTNSANVVKAQQQMLAGASAKVRREESSVGGALAEGVAGGSLFAQRRALAQQASQGGR